MVQGNRKSRSKTKRNPDKVALLGDHDLERDRTRTSRLAVYFTEIGSEFVYAHREAMMRELDCNDQQLSQSIWTLTEKWKLFRWDDKEGCYRRRYQRGEIITRDKYGKIIAKNPPEIKSEEFGIPLFKLRMQRTIHKRVALRWVLKDLLNVDGVFVPHSYADFAAQIDTTRSKISRYMNGYTTPKGVEVPGLIEVMNLSVMGDHNTKPTYYRNPNGTRQEIESEPNWKGHEEDVAHDARPVPTRSK